MQNWIRFCDIIKFNNKTKNLVAKMALGFFLKNEQLIKLSGKILYVVPPSFDFPREILIDNIKLKDNNKKTIDISSNVIRELDSLEWKNKSLLISEDDFIEAFGDCSYDMSYKNYINKKVYDQNSKFLGFVQSVDGVEIQKHMIVSSDDGEIIIPIVDEFVCDIDEENIYVKIPDGLIDLNR